MSVLSAVLGGGLIVVAMWDVLRTTLGIHGGGRLTRWIASHAWAAAQRGASDGTKSWLRYSAGPTILLVTLLAWLLLLWIGWTLIFGAQAGAVLHGPTGRPAGFVDRLYFTGYTLFTLGIGDMVPRAGLWQVATTVATVNGFFVATLSVAYVIPTLAAAVEKHRLAAWIATLGRTPSEILARAWDGKTFAGLDGHLTALVPAIELHAQRHHAYPVVHYFHGADRRVSVATSIAALDEAVGLLLYAVPSTARPSTTTLRAIRTAVTDLLDTLGTGFVTERPEAPPKPVHGLLEGVNIELVPGGLARVGEDGDRRARLLAFVRDGGGAWFEDAATAPPPEAP